LYQGPAGQVSYVTLTVVTEIPEATRTYYRTETRNLIQTTVVASTLSRVYYVEDDSSRFSFPIVPVLLLVLAAVLVSAIVVLRNRRGTKVDAKFCMQCGSVLENGYDFCVNCGKRRG
jgi:hypothetical protein